MLKAWNARECTEWKRVDRTTWSRTAGLNELNFYRYALSDPKAPSDCFCRASISQTTWKDDTFESAVLEAWTLLRIKHPLLDCQFNDSAEDLKLLYSAEHRHLRAKQSIRWSDSIYDWEQVKVDLLNCNRIINDTHLSHLRVFRSSTTAEMVIVGSHAVVDGISILTAMNDFLKTLSAISTRVAPWPTHHNAVPSLPRAMESQMPIRQNSTRSLWQAAIANTLFDVKQRRRNLLQTVTFPECTGSPESRQKVYEFTRLETEKLLRACKAQSVTMGHLIYAASTAAFTGLLQPENGSHVSIGTPVNARRIFAPDFRARTDEVLLALSFLDVTLPCVAISGETPARDISRLWYLARMAKTSVQSSLEDPYFPYFTHIAQERRSARHTLLQDTSETSTASQTAMPNLSFGSSAIGNIDLILHLEALTFKVNDVSIGMRARSGESLMHSYSFRGRLRLSLIYDDRLGESRMQDWLNQTSMLMRMVLLQEGGTSLL